MNPRRVWFTVEMNLDQVPGWNHEVQDPADWLRQELMRRVPWYEPTVSKAVLVLGGKAPDDSEQSVEETWREIWREIVAPNGVLDEDQVKRELRDYAWLMRAASKVYDALTFTVSKPNTEPDVVIELAEQRRKQQADEACDDGECKCALEREKAGTT